MRNKLWWLFGASTLLLFAIAAWMLRPSTPAVRAGETFEFPAQRNRVSEMARVPIRSRPGALETAEEGTPRVVGQVVVDGVPVQGGTLSLSCLDDEGGTTRIPGGVVAIDDEGRFEGPACRGTVCAELQHPGFVRQGAWRLSAGGRHTLEARLPGRVQGEVLHADGSPVAGVRVLASPHPEEADPISVPPFTTTSTTTDAEGRFTFVRVEPPVCPPCLETCDPDLEGAVRPPTYDAMRLIVSAAGFPPQVTNIDVQTVDVVRIVLAPPTGAIRGQVVDLEGQAYPRAFVLADAEGKPPQRVEVRQGQFSVPTADDDVYDLRAIQDGRELAAVRGAKPGDIVDLRGDVPATGVAVSLRVTWNGRPAASIEMSGGPFSGAITDAQGRAWADKVLPGVYTLLARRPNGSNRHTKAITVGSEPRQTIVLELNDGP